MTFLARLFTSSELHVSATLVGTAGQLGRFVLRRIDATPRAPIADLFLQGGWHGTTEARIGAQIQQGQFADRGEKVYFATRETAVHYALSRARYDQSKPVVLKIASKQKPERNPVETEGWGLNGGLKDYAFFQTEKGPVKILDAYKIEEVRRNS
jgi:hypothetical protein